MKSTTKLSIIIATYNCARTLEDCLTSIFEQTYPHIEVVVADGASTDGTLDILRSYSGKLGNWISEPDRGLYDALNKAIDRTTGDWIYVMGADDTLHAPNIIEQAMKQLVNLDETTMIAYGAINYVYGDGRQKIWGPRWEIAKRHVRSRMPIPHQGVFHARSLFDRFGGFDTELQIAGDYKIIIQSLTIAEPVFLENLCIANHHEGGKSSLRENRIKSLMEVRKIQIDYGYPITFDWLFTYAKGIIWTILIRARSALSFASQRRNRLLPK
ncbi:glycosyltransferase family 2 protein [Yoonia sp. R78084]|uniref:glycosyltransferase family 2 protein n=1 Tax=Yoonia sp. R78084 TaxID=3093869 RepID=UPI0037DC8797